jgi:hypothetical protein
MLVFEPNIKTTAFYTFRPFGSGPSREFHGHSLDLGTFGDIQL